MPPETTVGFRQLHVTDPIQNTPIPTWVLYPARAPERPMRFGPYELPLAADAAIEGSGLPLVVISHGHGGSPWTHRGTALHLAKAGFAVALFEHPGNSRSDNSLANTTANLANRPRHLRVVLDAIERNDDLAARVAPGGGGVIGHSIGAYTALALAGGKPSSIPHEEPDSVCRPVPVTRDARVRALVLLAPASIWYATEGALAGVELPIFMRSGERDSIAPSLHTEIILRGVADPERVDHQIVQNAGHFSFQTPFPPTLTRPDFPPSQDPAGFDRRAYHEALNAEVAAFFTKTLVRAS